MGTNEKKMTTGSPGKLIITFAIPLMLGNILQQFYTMADTMIVGQVVGVRDSLTGAKMTLYYTIMRDFPVITRSMNLENDGDQSFDLTRAMSACLDLPDKDYEWIQLSGAWAREREIKTRKLEQGIQSVGSLRGNSSHNHNPFIALKRQSADEFQGDVIGMSLVYSGNFLMQDRKSTRLNSSHRSQSRMPSSA